MMSQTKNATINQSIDIAALTTVIVTFACAVAFAIEGHTLSLILLSLICELFCVWLIRRPTVEGRNAATSFLFKLQLHGMMEIALNIVGIAGVAWLFFLSVSFDAPKFAETDPGLFNFFSVQNFGKLFTSAFALLPIASLTLSIVRIHALYRAGVKLNDLVDEGFNQTRMSLPASQINVSKRLNHYLTLLQTSSTPKFSRQFVKTSVTVSHGQPKSDNTFEIRWSFCPVYVQIEIKPSTSISTEVDVHYKLRNGYNKLAIMPNPGDVHALKEYLDKYVFQHLKSDLVLTHAVDKQNELRLQAAETQLRILQAQIEPHFLFNTLANVRQLYRSNLEAGENMMDHLIVYLRSAMEDLRCDVSTVGKEMDLALHYLAIMKIRMGERLSYSFIIPDLIAQENFPPAMLISLVENAIKHGLQNRDDGKLTISAARENDKLRVTVEDNGAGFSSVEGTGVGLSNIRQRLEGLYGNRAWLEVGALQTGGFMASILIPLVD